jgi:two-component system, NarL family, invasion response regulator UvrY
MKILIADDQPLVREALKLHLERNPEVTAVKEAGSGMETIKVLRTDPVDILILDLSMPGMDGVEVLMQINNLSISVRILVMSFYPPDLYATKVLGLGALGYINKGASIREFLYAIERIMQGGRYLPSDFMEQLVFQDGGIDGKMPHERLSDREMQVMLFLAQGLTLGEIAVRLHLSEKTVSTYRSRIMQKMGLRNNVHLATYALHHKMIE